MDSTGTPPPERSAGVFASITFQNAGRAAEAALAEWRRQMLAKSANETDCKQEELHQANQRFADRHNSEVKEAAKCRRVTIKAGDFEPGPKRTVPVKLPRVARIPPYQFWTLAGRNVKPWNQQAAQPGLVFGEGGEATLLQPEDDEDGEGGGAEEGPHFDAPLLGEVEDHRIWVTCQKHGTGRDVLHTLAQLLLHAEDKKHPTDEEAKMLELRYRSFLPSGPYLHFQQPVTSGPRSRRRFGSGEEGRPLALTPEGGWPLEAGEATGQAAMRGAAVDEEPRSMEAGLDSFDNLFCRRCYVHDCHLHGIGQARLLPVANQMPASAPAPMNGLDLSQPCGPTCYLLAHASHDKHGGAMEAQHAGTGASEGSGDVGIEWSDAQDRGQGGASSSGGLASQRERTGNEAWRQFEVDVYEQGLRMYGEQGSCCRIARLMDGRRTCADVAQRMATLRPQAAAEGTGALAAATDSNPQAAGRKRKRAKYNRKLNWLQARLRALNVKKLESEGDPHGRLKLKAYTPCDCTDECTPACPCQQAPTLCEKFCACPATCRFKAVGCKCTSACTTRACPCVASDRECDPDLCQGCMLSCGGASCLEVPEANPYGRHSAGGVQLDRCQNMKLQQRRHKKILLGPSAVAGWGAFVCGGAAAGELLGEYTGELVNDQEADSRGAVYDANNKSFLFQLNDQYILDAFHKGDKLKFANHSPSPNCRPRVVSVLGDHRVALHVERRLESGEELFFDYNYTEHQAPEWALTEADRKKREREMQEARKANKKGTKK